MATAQSTVEAAPKKRKLGKLLIILVAVLLTLTAAGVGGIVYLKKKQAAAEYAEDEEYERPAKAARRDLNAKPVFASLDMFTVNLADRDADRYAQISITLELANEGASEIIKNHMPLIRSYVLMTLSHKTSAELLAVDGKKTLAVELRREVSRALGLQVPEDAAPPPRRAEAAADEDDEVPKPRRRAKLKPEETTPVLAVHFVNFIVQ